MLFLLHLLPHVGAFFYLEENMSEPKPKKYFTVAIESIEEDGRNATRNAWLNCTISNGFVSNIRFRASITDKEAIARQLINLGNKILATNKRDYE